MRGGGGGVEEERHSVLVTVYVPHYLCLGLGGSPGRANFCCNRCS